MVISLGQRLTVKEQEGTNKEDINLDNTTQELIYKAILDIKAIMTSNLAPSPNYLDAYN